MDVLRGCARAPWLSTLDADPISSSNEIILLVPSGGIAALEACSRGFTRLRESRQWPTIEPECASSQYQYAPCRLELRRAVTSTRSGSAAIRSHMAGLCGNSLGNLRRRTEGSYAMMAVHGSGHQLLDVAWSERRSQSLFLPLCARTQYVRDWSSRSWVPTSSTRRVAGGYHR